MKYIRILFFTLFLAPFGAVAANNDFMVAAQLLAAAKNADIQQVQSLVNQGANVNYVDATGVSIVCTALMNNDVRAAQILQMYGADASQCDRQIKQYKSKAEPVRSGGLFSGLSSAQSMALTAAGAAVVVGGLFLLTDVFDPGNENDVGSVGDGDRPGGEDTSGGNTATPKFVIPYGPAMPSQETENANYADNLNFYSPTTGDSVLKDSFAMMSKSYYGQNYLLMMHGYSPLARGYYGQRTLRNSTSNNAPALLQLNNDWLYKFDGLYVQGGKPVNVALVTRNGINATPDSSLGYYDETTASYDFLLYGEMNGNTVNNANNNMIYGKYYNNKIVRGQNNDTVLDDTMTEDAGLLWDDKVQAGFDFGRYGTVINNPNATEEDNLLAKVLGGKTSGYSAADFIGFMPNGQMSVFRTGNGTGLKALAAGDEVLTGTYTMAGDSFAVGDTISLFGQTFTIENVGGNGVNNMLVLNQQALAPVAQDETQAGGDEITGDVTDDTTTGDSTTGDGTSTDENAPSVDETPEPAIVYNAYIGADGYLYVNSNGGTLPNQAYSMSTDGKLTLVKQEGAIDYMNYEALLYGALHSLVDTDLGRSRMDILANAAIVPTLYANAEGIDVVMAQTTTTQRRAKFTELVHKYYNQDDSDGVSPGVDAVAFFNGLGSSYFPLVVFSTGGTQIGASDYASYTGATIGATFENSAPLVFANLEHLFMSVVPVGLTGTGTSDATNVSGFNTENKIAVSQWKNTNGTPDDLTDDLYYRGRVCGIAGQGTNGIDPWCFSAAGVTDELAVSAAAGAAGAIKGAFNYMTNDEVFTLLALTADGPFLGTDTDGLVFDKNSLTAYLQNMYQLPNEYQYEVENGTSDYLDVFKRVFGYGLINLERATTPNTKLFFYDGQNIVSSVGNAYWRMATNTMFRPSSVMNLRGASISASAYDVLSSIDGELSMPRIWENRFNLGTDDAQGLYMGDVLGELNTRRDNGQRVQIGNVGLSMTTAQRAYIDNWGGLDTLSVDWTSGNWNMTAGYQHYFTDGVSRFNGLANPVLGLATDVVVSDAEYKNGNWSFGGRIYAGNVTEEGLLENDPTIASQFMPGRLGKMQGASASARWDNGEFAFGASVGSAVESDTLLGAKTDGLFALGGGKTVYADVVSEYNLTDDISLTARATFAETSSDATGAVVLGLDNVQSNAWAVGANVGNFEFVVSQPLAITDGAMRYAHSEYDVVKNDAGKYDLVVKDMGVRELDLAPEKREVRLSATYRHNFGQFTDGAVGLIYRINPSHTDDFGNESIFMFKLTHSLGI